MINSKLARKVMVGGTFLAAIAVPAMAFAQETAPTVAVCAERRNRQGDGRGRHDVHRRHVRRLRAVQDRCRCCGHSGREPEAGTNLIVITALTEIIVLMGFVIAFMINAA